MSKPGRRLSRTLSRARWGEYRSFLEAAREARYAIVPLEAWVAGEGHERGAEGDLVLILRHDVDQHPASALRMAGVERALGLTSTWYLRWRTADPAVIAELRRAGHTVGLHYETLTRMALAGAPEPSLDEGRAELRREIAAFGERFGPIRSVAPHGDSRVPEVSNAALLHGQDAGALGVEFDGNEAMRGRGISCWLTDRSAAEGGWRDGIEPADLFARGVSPILCLTHPNNWVSGASLWLDRFAAALLPAPRGGWPRRPTRTGSDRPPG